MKIMSIKTLLPRSSKAGNSMIINRTGPKLFKAKNSTVLRISACLSVAPTDKHRLQGFSKPCLWHATLALQDNLGIYITHCRSTIVSLYVPTWTLDKAFYYVAELNNSNSLGAWILSRCRARHNINKLAGPQFATTQSFISGQRPLS